MILNLNHSIFERIDSLISYKIENIAGAKFLEVLQDSTKVFGCGDFGEQMVWIRSSGVEILENRWFGLDLRVWRFWRTDGLD